MTVLDFDASKKQCPLVNQHVQLAMCIGPDCMGWRYISGHIGYCGFAGKPDTRQGRKNKKAN